MSADLKVLDAAPKFSLADRLEILQDAVSQDVSTTMILFTLRLLIDLFTFHSCFNIKAQSACEMRECT